jgi:putrescine transport system permease protein
LSLDDLVISSFVSGPGATTLPMLIFAKVRLGVTPDINAIATIIIVLVMPEIITGLSLLFVFISMADWIGWPASRGATTITIAHITFSMAYVAVVVRSRLAGMDETLEEAAMDLGGRPLAVFFDVTVPLLLPALVAGWLLSFTLSLDDLVISSFVSGPGATTLPMLIFAKVRLGVTPDINAIATIIIVLVMLGVGIAALVSNRGRLATR